MEGVYYELLVLGGKCMNDILLEEAEILAMALAAVEAAKANGAEYLRRAIRVVGEQEIAEQIVESVVWRLKVPTRNTTEEDQRAEAKKWAEAYVRSCVIDSLRDIAYANIISEKPQVLDDKYQKAALEQWLETESISRMLGRTIKSAAKFEAFFENVFWPKWRPMTPAEMQARIEELEKQEAIKRFEQRQVGRSRFGEDAMDHRVSGSFEMGKRR